MEEYNQRITPTSAGHPWWVFVLWAMLISTWVTPWPLALFYLFVQSDTHTSGGTPVLNLLELVGTLMWVASMFLLLFLVPCMIAVLLVPKSWKLIPAVITLGTINILVLGGVGVLQMQYDRSRMEAAFERAQPIIQGLEAYRRDKGEYPAKLVQLAPAYLKEIPVPGLQENSDYDYTPPGPKAHPTRYELSFTVRGGLSLTSAYYWPRRSTSGLIDSEEELGGERMGDWILVSF